MFVAPPNLVQKTESWIDICLILVAIHILNVFIFHGPSGKGEVKCPFWKC